MKKLLLLLIIASIATCAVGQASKIKSVTVLGGKELHEMVEKIMFDSLTREIELSPLEKMTFKEYNNFVKEVEGIRKQVQKREEEHQVFLRRLLLANKIPLDRVSASGDSLIITDIEILVKLKKSKK